jgi:hypothetical protein
MITQLFMVRGKYLIQPVALDCGEKKNGHTHGVEKNFRPRSVCWDRIHDWNTRKKKRIHDWNQSTQ